MGIEATATKDCPSCGSRIDEAAVKCSYCNSGLGHCTGCQAWIVVGTECFDCGKSTAIRALKAVKAVKEPPRLDFEGSPAGLLPLLLVRALLGAAFAAAVLFAIAASNLGPATRSLVDHGISPKSPAWKLWAAAGALFVLTGCAGHFVRRWRLNHTIFWGQPAVVGTSPGSLILNFFITVLVLALTAGLGLPWIYARYRRSFYRGCALPGRGGRPLGFQGGGEEVLGRFLLSLLLLPLAIATAGLLLLPLAWIWACWDHRNVLVPDKHGQYFAQRFKGSFGGYAAIWLKGWVLSLATLGIYRPWARVAEWRWMIAHTEIP